MFSDIVMDGIALARVVRQRRPDLPILLAAGYSQAAGLPSSAGSPGQARR
jgi:CheY-like chemotaxis protein